MNFRVNVAVACAAALSFACAEKPANIPELEAALQAPPGMQVVGLYRMDVTPVQTPAGIQFAFEPVPVGADGNPSTNPPGTVQVKGTFGLSTPWAGGGIRCAAGSPTISAAVQITNFAVDPLTSVWAQVVDMAGTTGNNACNPTQSGGGFNNAERALGVWQYNNLAGAPNDLGTAAGGTSAPLAGQWTFQYGTTTPFRFFFRVMAENSAPTTTLVDPAGPTAPLTWSSTVANNTLLEICPGVPAAGFQTPCPVASTTTPVGPIGGVAPWAFSFAPTGLTPGATYYWRAKNVFPAGTSRFYSPWKSFTFGSANPVVSPATFLANDAIALLTWTAPAAVTRTYYFLCLGPCPNPLPAPLAAQQNVLVQGELVDIAPTTVTTYFLDVAANLALDTTTGVYFDTAAVYDLRVFAFDGINSPTDPTLGSTAAITITPVQLYPAVTEPASYTAAAPTWTITWTADAQFADTVLDVCVPDCATDPFPNSVAVPPTVVGGNSYSYNLKGLTGPLAAASTFEFWVSNPDLAGTTRFWAGLPALDPLIPNGTGGVRTVQ